MTYDLYAGFYQGLAWTQGFRQEPLHTSLPDHLMTEEGELEFDLQRFFEVVADLDDEGQIHYWDPDPETGTMILYCTEDSTPHPIPDSAHTAVDWVTIARDTS